MKLSFIIILKQKYGKEKIQNLVENWMLHTKCYTSLKGSVIVAFCILVWNISGSAIGMLPYWVLVAVVREFKHDVYGRRQTAKITSDFLFFCCNHWVNHTKIEKCLLLFSANTKKGPGNELWGFKISDRQCSLLYHRFPVFPLIPSHARPGHVNLYTDMKSLTVEWWK